MLWQVSLKVEILTPLIIRILYEIIYLLITLKICIETYVVSWFIVIQKVGLTSSQIEITPGIYRTSIESK